MKAEHGAGGAWREGVLELVAVVEVRLGRHCRLERRVGDPAQADERVANLRLLRRELGLVRVVLEPAAATGRKVVARRLDPLGARLEHVDDPPFGVALPHLPDPRAHEIARQAAADEDDVAVHARDAVSSVGERVDPELDLVTRGDGSGHGG